MISKEEVEGLEAKLAKAIEALEFYANFYPGIEIRDGGDHARAILEELKKQED